MPPRKRDATATRAALLRAGSSAFASRGFSGARTQTIADEAGVNKALILYHFGGKQGLYSAVILDHIVRAQSRITEALEDLDSPAERLDAFVGTFGKCMAEAPDFSRIVMREQMGGAHRLEPEVRDRFFGFFAIVRGVLEDGIRSGEFRSLDPHSTHLSLVGSLVMYQLTAPARETYERQESLPVPIPSWPDYVEHVRQLFQLGLRPDRGVEATDKDNSKEGG
jgi:TetR/AcrR family transcriptional regulator